MSEIKEETFESCTCLRNRAVVFDASNSAALPAVCSHRGSPLKGFVQRNGGRRVR